MNPILKIGRSPNVDDAYGFCAFVHKAVAVEGFEIEHVVEDIQSLNQKALKAALDVTSVSAAVYPTISKNYWILDSGARVGRNYGTIIVAKNELPFESLNGKKIAVPGRDTTAFLLLNLSLDSFESVPVPFDKVIAEVQKGTVDAGLLIHEGQLNFKDEGVLKCADLGRMWYQKFNLPIPLRLNVVKKNLGVETAKKIGKAFFDSIRYAMDHETEALEYAGRFGRGVNSETLKKFCRMYVNQDTLSLGFEGKQSLEVLYREAALKGFCKSIENVEII